MTKQKIVAAQGQDRRYLKLQALGASNSASQPNPQRMFGSLIVSQFVTRSEKRRGKEVGIVGQPLGAVRVQPSALLLQGLRVIEVKDGNERSDFRRKQIVNRSCRSRRRPASLGLPLPCGRMRGQLDRETVGIHAQVAHVADVFGENDGIRRRRPSWCCCP